MPTTNAISSYTVWASVLSLADPHFCDGGLRMHSHGLRLVVVKESNSVIPVVEEDTRCTCRSLLRFTSKRLFRRQTIAHLLGPDLRERVIISCRTASISEMTIIRREKLCCIAQNTTHFNAFGLLWQEHIHDSVPPVIRSDPHLKPALD